MESQVRVVNIRLPKELADHIDQCISTIQLHTTRPDYLIDSLRSLFTWILNTRIVDEDEEQAEIVTAMRMFHIRTILESFLDEFNDYKGSPVQVVVRIPLGLFERINAYNDSLRPFANFMDLLRAASIFGLHNTKDWLNLLDPDNYTLDPIFDAEKTGCDFVSMFKDYDHVTELYKYCKKRMRK